ncbi:Uncharacterised protein [Klebsiella pneumoniae]|nr:Uncharacterised protein [Klebsiella pneumoniae]
MRQLSSILGWLYFVLTYVSLLTVQDAGMSVLSHASSIHCKRRLSTVWQILIFLRG